MVASQLCSYLEAVIVLWREPVSRTPVWTASSRERPAPLRRPLCTLYQTPERYSPRGQMHTFGLGKTWALRSSGSSCSRQRTTASLAISAGANVKVVQRLLGHATAAMTLDRYGHLLSDDLTGAADALRRHREHCGISRRV
jgi:integrase